MDEYTQKTLLTEDEKKLLTKYKKNGISIGIPIMDGFYNKINGYDTGINYYSAVQLEKDFGISVNLVYSNYSDLQKKLQNDEIQIISGIQAYNENNLSKYNNDVVFSSPYSSVKYSVFTKNHYYEKINLYNIKNSKVGILTCGPLIDSVKVFINDSGLDGNAVFSDNIYELLNNKDIEYYFMPENSLITSMGYYEEDLSQKNFYSKSHFALKKSNMDLLALINKFNTDEKSTNLSFYKENMDRAKLATGFYFTNDEKDYLNRTKNILVQMQSDFYPSCFYDTTAKRYDGQLVVILNRLMALTGLNYTTVTLNSAEKLNLYEQVSEKKVDLVAGLSNEFIKRNEVYFTNNIQDISYLLVGYDKTFSYLNQIEGEKIGVVDENVAYEYFKDTIPTIDVKPFEDYQGLYNALKNNKIDYMVTSTQNFYYLINSFKDYKLKIAYNLELNGSKTFATQHNKDGFLLVSILDKSLKVSNREEILNSGYILGQADTFGNYKTHMFNKIYLAGFIVLFLFILFLLWTNRKSNISKIEIINTNKALSNAFLSTKACLWTIDLYKGIIYFDINSVEIFGFLNEDLVFKDNNVIIKINDLKNKYIVDNTFFEYIKEKNNLLINGKIDSVEKIFIWHPNGDLNKEIYVKIRLFIDEHKISSKDNYLTYGILRDITKEYLYNKNLEDKAKTDDLTIAKNRNALYELNIKDLAQKTIAYLDLDDFKLINDMYGHNIGDLLLITLVKRLKSKFFIDEIFRIGGDEFLIILNFFNKDIANEMLKTVSEPIKYASRNLTVHGSYGFLEIIKNEKYSIETIISLVDFGMGIVKSSGKNNYKIIDDFLIAEFKEKSLLDAKLKNAVENHEIIAYYQPYINLSTNKISGYEALMRWQFNDKILTPNKFLEYAIKSDLIYDIDLQIFETSLIFYKYLQDNNLIDSDFVASSNFTATTLIRVKPIQLYGLAKKYNIPIKNISIEITEQLITNFNVWENIKLIKSLGFKISLDDFSVGHSSLKSLKNFPVDVLKIDKSLLDDVFKNEINSKIYKTIVTLGKSFDAKIVAEGVENSSQVDFLKKVGVNYGQGYNFSRPINRKEFLKKL